MFQPFNGSPAASGWGEFFCRLVEGEYSVVGEKGTCIHLILRVAIGDIIPFSDTKRQVRYIADWNKT